MHVKIGHDWISNYDTYFKLAKNDISFIKVDVDNAPRLPSVEVPARIFEDERQRGTLAHPIQHSQGDIVLGRSQR
jgi:hypothetical protein